MIGLLQLLTVFVIVPFLTYWAIGLYVMVRITISDEFSLWGELLSFSHAEEVT